MARGSGPIPRQSAIVGIDFGTTYTSVSAAIDNRIIVLPWPGGEKAIPTVVTFPTAGHYVIGSAARDRLLYDPKHTIPSAKRLLGCKLPNDEVERHLAQASYQTAVAPDGGVMVEMFGEQYAMAQICSYFLREARRAAELALEVPVEHAVMTVPVSFDEARIRMLRRAAELAQLEVIEMIDEPSAAAMANRSRPGFGGLVGVYDFGGGTFDFSLVDASAGDFRILATAGDSWLGGDDLDLVLANAVADQFWRVHGVDLRNRQVEWQQLLFGCEQAKRALSISDVTNVVVPRALRTATGNHDLEMRIKRQVAERLWAPLINRSVDVCERALAAAKVAPSRLSAIYLSGGTSYVPAVRATLRERFNAPVAVGAPPELAAAIGAGLVAGDIERRDSVIVRAA